MDVLFKSPYKMEFNLANDALKMCWKTQKGKFYQKKKKKPKKESAIKDNHSTFMPPDLVLTDTCALGFKF